MPSLDASESPLELILAEAFAPQLESGEVDLVVTPSRQEHEVQADEWTLHLEGFPVEVAFIALDDEPATLAEAEAALDAALDNQHFAALRKANRLLGNAIVAALEASGDELSALLARVLSTAGSEDLLDSLDD